MALRNLLPRSNNALRGEFPEAYFRIVSFFVDQDRNMVQFQVRAYADEVARRYPNGLNPELISPGMEQKSLKEYHLEFTLPPDAPANLLKWGYDQIKTDSRFSGAVDC